MKTTNKYPNNSVQLLRKLLARWDGRHVKKLVVAAFELHEVSVANEQRLRKLFRKHGYHLAVIRQSGDVIMAIMTDKFVPIHSSDHLPWEIKMHRGRPTGYETVIPELVPMESIPAGANPFLHDHIRMGTDLTRGWIVMHNGGDSKDVPEGHQFLYLVNTRTGQRIGLRFHPQC